MNTRPLNKREKDLLATMCGSALNLTCEGDYGLGPCGTYLDWTDGVCVNGHPLEIDMDEEALQDEEA